MFHTLLLDTVDGVLSFALSTFSMQHYNQQTLKPDLILLKELTNSYMVYIMYAT